VLSLLLAGGPFMFATLAVSLVTLAIFIWRLVFLWGKSASRRAMLAQVLGYTEARDYAKAIQLCAGSQSPLAKILNSALVRANRSEREIRRSVEAVALEEIPKVKAGTVFMPQLSNLATLLGLIGTIHGLIVAFGGAGSENAATRQAVLSQGIAIAFYNTFFGLTVATAAVVMYLVLIGKTNQTLAFIEQGAASVIDAILWHREVDHEPKQRSA
jgi:biopolymer transport protein ExbB